MELPARHGILFVLAASATGALLGWSVKFAMASSSGADITRGGASMAAAASVENPRHGESNQSASGTATADATGSTGVDPAPPSTSPEVGGGRRAPASAPGQGLANEKIFPTGWRPMPQAQVTAEMTAWATTIVESKGTYPMGSTTTQTFDDTAVMARVEWHPPSLKLNTVHRGVTLYRAAMDDVAMGELPKETDP